MPRIPNPQPPHKTVEEPSDFWISILDGLLKPAGYSPLTDSPCDQAMAVILDDVTDRRGWSQAWEGFDSEVQAEITERMRHILKHFQRRGVAVYLVQRWRDRSLPGWSADGSPAQMVIEFQIQGLGFDLLIGTEEDFGYLLLIDSSHHAPVCGLDRHEACHCSPVWRVEI